MAAGMNNTYRIHNNVHRVVGGHRIMFVDTAPFTTDMQHAPSNGPKTEVPELSYHPPIFKFDPIALKNMHG